MPKQPIDIPNEPLVLTSLLEICKGGLEAITNKLYETEVEGADVIAEILEDAWASVEMAQSMCKQKKL